MWGQGQGLDRVSVRGQGSGVKVRVMIGSHRVRGQGRWSRSGYRSWGQVGGGSRSGVQVRGQGLGSGQGLGQGCGQGQESRLWGQGQGHDRWSQGRGSMSGVKVRGVVKVRGGGQGLAHWGQMIGGGG